MLTLATYSGWLIKIVLLEVFPEYRTADAGVRAVDDFPIST